MKHGVINDTMMASEAFLELSKIEKYYGLITRFSNTQITNCFIRLKKKHDSCSIVGGIQ
jgi:hypothetical protein